MPRSRRHLAGPAALLLAVLAACTSTPPPSTPSTTPSTTAAPATASPSAPTVAGHFDVDGRKVYLECHGEGSPTVVLLAGYGNAGDIWATSEANPPAVLPGVAQFTRVCTYDRPGTYRTLDDQGVPANDPLRSRTDPAPLPRAGAEVVTELHGVLAAAGIAPPYVLVGHSLGGLFSLLYARTHPDQVSGILLVDATPPALKKLMTAKEWQTILVDQLRHPVNPISGYKTETYDLDKVLRQLDAAPALPRRPVIMLTATEEQPGTPGEVVLVFQRVLPRARAEFAKSIPGVQVESVPGTSHYIQLERPDLVIARIKTLVGG